MTTTDTIYVVLLGISAFLSGFFSGSETALIGIGRERVHQLAQTGKRGRRVAQLAAEPDRLLSTLLVANNLVNILGAAVATSLFIDLIGQRWGPWLSTAVVTAVILVVGEITPKSLAARYPERFSLTVAPTIWQLSRVLGPVARLFTSVTRGLFRLIGITPEVTSTSVTDDDIRALAMLGVQGGEIDAVEREIIDALFGLADQKVRDVMTPRVDIKALTLPITTDEVREIVASTGHSRFLVTRGDLDHVVGVLYVKDLLAVSLEPSPEDIERMLRAPHYVPETKSVLELLQEMRARRFAFAVILDEHGGVDGVATIKDLVSELVGELQDEYDPGAPSVVRIAAGQWLADGRMPVEEASTEIGSPLPVGPYSTLGGLFLTVAGRIPGEGDSVDIDGLRLTVLQMDRNRIERIRIDVRS